MNGLVIARCNAFVIENFGRTQVKKATENFITGDIADGLAHGNVLLEWL